MLSYKFNNHPGYKKVSILDVIKWGLGLFQDRPYEIAPKNFSYPVLYEKFNSNKPSATWINHSTYLIKFHGLHFLTDPIFSNRCSPFKWIGPKRLHAPGIAIDKLPKIDYVLISHDHYDHLCKESVLKLHAKYPKILWIVPIGVKEIFYKWGIKNIKELSWWEHHVVENLALPCSITFTAVPSQHFSGRKMWNENSTLWCGYVVSFQTILEESKQFYFVGDTGYNEQYFKKIGDRFGKMDLSLIPIGTYLPEDYMAPIHIGPKRAVQIHQEVRSKRSLGMHWKTFKLSNEPCHQPPYDLYHEMVKNELDPLTFLAIEPGVTVNW